MQLKCTPLVPPSEWGRYSGQAQEVIIVALNAGDLAQPCWFEAVFDLELFCSSWGTRKDVHIFDSEAEEFETQPLAQWVTSVKPSLRGNIRGVLYYNTCGRWCRLQALLDEQVQVSVVHHCFACVWHVQAVLQHAHCLMQAGFHVATAPSEDGDPIEPSHVRP